MRAEEYDEPAPRGKRAPKPAKPKTFSLHWGSGIVEEEVRIETPHHRPTIQLLKFLDGAAAGTYEIRFCYYDRHGRFQRSPMILDAKDVRRMHDALKTAPKLKRLISALAR